MAYMFIIIIIIIIIIIKNVIIIISVIYLNDREPEAETRGALKPWVGSTYEGEGATTGGKK